MGSNNLVLIMIVPTLLFLFSTVNNGFAQTMVGSFETRQHNVKGDVYFTGDDTVLEIKNFHYDGTGPDAFFYVGKFGTKPQQANSKGFQVPYPENQSGKKLNAFNGETIQIKLP